MRIESGGNLLLRSTDSANITAHSSPYLEFRAGQTNGQNVSLGKIKGYSPGGWGGDIIFETKPANGQVNDTTVERLRIRESGGITFNGDTANANTLNDYEEGTWTPVYSTSGGGQSQTYNNQYGVYTKIGNLVTIHFNLDISSSSNIGSGDVAITGLPYASGSTSTTTNFNRSPFSTYDVNYDSTDGTQMHLYIPTSNQTKLQILYSRDNSSWFVGTTSNFNIGTGRTIIVMGSLSYYTDS